MGEPGKDHLIQLIRLAFDRCDDGGMPVPVRHHPPRRNAIKNPPPVLRRCEPGANRSLLPLVMALFLTNMMTMMVTMMLVVVMMMTTILCVSSGATKFCY
jgi:hypothetical protein